MYFLGQCGVFWRGEIKIYLQTVADLVDTAFRAPIGLLLPGWAGTFICSFVVWQEPSSSSGAKNQMEGFNKCLDVNQRYS
jgi:hypothetical protein